MIGLLKLLGDALAMIKSQDSNFPGIALNNASDY